MDFGDFQQKKNTSADLFASVLCCLLVSLSLLSSVQGILLVELEHLHLLLDGVHGCFLCSAPTKRPNENQEGSGRAFGASVPNWTRSWSTGPAWLYPVKYVLSRGGDWIPLDIEYFFGGGVCGCPGFFKALLCDSLLLNIWLLIRLYMGCDGQAGSSHGKAS